MQLVFPPSTVLLLCQPLQCFDFHRLPSVWSQVVVDDARFKPALQTRNWKLESYCSTNAA